MFVCVCLCGAFLPSWRNLLYNHEGGELEKLNEHDKFSLCVREKLQQTCNSENNFAPRWKSKHTARKKKENPVKKRKKEKRRKKPRTTTYLPGQSANTFGQVLPIWALSSCQDSRKSCERWGKLKVQPKRRPPRIRTKKSGSDGQSNVPASSSAVGRCLSECRRGRGRHMHTRIASFLPRNMCQQKGEDESLHWQLVSILFCWQVC